MNRVRSYSRDTIQIKFNHYLSKNYKLLHFTPSSDKINKKNNYLQLIHDLTDVFVSKTAKF